MRENVNLGAHDVHCARKQDVSAKVAPSRRIVRLRAPIQTGSRAGCMARAEVRGSCAPVVFPATGWCRCGRGQTDRGPPAISPQLPAHWAERCLPAPPGCSVTNTIWPAGGGGELPGPLGVTSALHDQGLPFGVPSPPAPPPTMGLVAMMEHLPAQVVHRSLMPVLDLCTVNALLRVSRHMNQLLAPVSHGGVVRYAREVLAAADVAGDPTARANLQCLHAKLAGVLADLYARSLRNQACPAAFQERHRIVAAMETGLPHLPVPWIDVEGWQSSTAFLVAMQSGNYLLIKRHLRRIPPTRDNRRDDDEDAIVFYLRRPQGPDAVGYTVQIAFQLMHTGSAEPDSRREAWYSGLVNPAVLEDVLKELLGARGDRPDPVAAQAILESCPRSKQVVFRPSDHAVPSDGNLRDLSVFLACLRAMLPFWPPALHLDMYVIVVEYQPEPTGMDLSPFEFTQEPVRRGAYTESGHVVTRCDPPTQGPVRRACESILHRVVDVVRPAPRFFSCRRPDVAVQPFERNARSRPCRASLTYLLHRVFCEPLLGWSMASTVLGTMRLVRSAFALFNNVDPGNVGRAHRETAATLVRDGLVTYVDAVGAVINPFIVMQVSFTFAVRTCRPRARVRCHPG